MRINLQAKEKLWNRLKEGHFIPNQMNAETPRHIIVYVLIIKNKTNSITIQEENGLPTKKQKILAFKLSPTTLNS